MKTIQHSRRFFSTAIILLVGLLFWMPIQAEAQPDPRGSFLRSLAVPGWGHYYNDSDNWLRGQVHLGAELVLIGSYFGFTARAGNLEDQYLTFANHKAGVSIDDRSRAFRLALGQHDNLGEYNDFQLRSRNWDQLFADSPENRWEWKTSEDRQRYQELREKSDNARNQLPAIAALMVVNRAISAVSAYRRARNMANGPELVFTPVHPMGSGETGIVANLSFRF